MIRVFATALATPLLPTLASFCAEQIDTIERRLDSAVAIQVAERTRTKLKFLRVRHAVSGCACRKA